MGARARSPCAVILQVIVFLWLCAAPALAEESLPAPDDPAYSELLGDLYVQWPLHTLDALAAWSSYPARYFTAADRPQGTPVVAVIDTGVDPRHPDFMNPGASGADVSEGGQLMLSSARAFLTNQPGSEPADVTDEHGHGTHLAGLIAAAADNGLTAGSGIAGLGYPLRLLPLKVAGADGVATHADIASAITYAADQGASVILIGFVGPTWSHGLQDALDYAWDRGCFLVAPAGDAGAGAPAFPAACPHVFGVASLTPSGTLASYSGQGDHVALAAAGGDEAVGIYSTLPTYSCTLRTNLTTPAYGWLFGTSQAAAHVAAAAALYMGSAGIRPETGDEGAVIWQALQQSADPIGEMGVAGWHPACGYGALTLTCLLPGQSSPNSGLGSIVGRVLLAGAPAIGASVTATLQETGETVVASSLWPAGACRLANLPPGVYRVSAQADGLSGEWERVTVRPGCDLPGVDFRLGDPSAAATLLAADIPAAAVRGGHLDLSVTFENTGESTWRRADGYCLRQVDCPSPISSVPEHIDLSPGEAVAPGETRVFSLSLPVPDGCGFYDVGLQMCQQGGQGFFGEVARDRVSVTSFLDVPADHWALGAIEAAHQAGIVFGYEGDHYCPAWPVSRDQMAVYLARALAGGEDGVPPGPDQPTFPDVGQDHWAYRHIEFVHGRDVVEGYPDGAYHPEEILDRGQMAVFMARAMAGGEAGLKAYTPPGTPTFPDVEPGCWNYLHVEYLEDSGVVSGYPDQRYHPDYLCSRDQMAVYVARAFDLQ